MQAIFLARIDRRESSSLFGRNRFESLFAVGERKILENYTLGVERRAGLMWACVLSMNGLSMEIGKKVPLM